MLQAIRACALITESAQMAWVVAKASRRSASPASHASRLFPPEQFVNLLFDLSGRRDLGSVFYGMQDAIL